MIQASCFACSVNGVPILCFEELSLGVTADNYWKYRP